MSPLFSPVSAGGIGKATVNAVTGATATLRNSDGKNYYQFNGSGSISVNSGTVGLFLVGGGGAGGSSQSGGGGGGGGGVVSLNAEYLAAGTYTVAAGAGGNSGNGYNKVWPGTGSDSYIGNITAAGGGFGGTILFQNIASNFAGGFMINPGRGGSGGGAFAATGSGYCGGNYGVGLGITNQGKSGGPTVASVGGNNNSRNGGGGGGGYSAVGGTGSYVSIGCGCSNPLGGNGGQGGNFTITNATVIYGSGGGAFSGQTPAGTGGTNGGNGGVANTAGNSGTAGNGSGGGSSNTSLSANAISGAGGSGTVIVVVG